LVGSFEDFWVGWSCLRFEVDGSCV
jgi:hypothetical protein